MIVTLSDIELTVTRVSEYDLCLSITSDLVKDSQLPILGQYLLELKHPSIIDVMATSAEILIQHQHHSTTQLVQELGLSKIEISDTNSPRIWSLPISFTEGDWNRVEQFTGMSARQYQQQISAVEFTVAMYGFIPGFAYLKGLPKELCVPRKSEPTKHVAAGSIALGGEYFGIYAVASPAGWNVIGKTPLRILETPKLPPVSYAIGDQVQLEVLDTPDYEELQHQQLSLSEYNQIDH